MTQGETFAFPASFAQQRLWLLDQLEPGRPTYNIPLNFRLAGKLDATALERAFTYLMERHEVLRTTFAAKDGEPQQVVHPPSPFALRRVDLSGMAADAQERELARLVDEEGNRPFDLRTGPLLRATLIALGDDRSVLLTTTHHIAADGWSFGILQQELAAAYAAYVRGEEPALPELAIQYADYAVWQRDRLSGTELDDNLAWWTKQLAHPLPVLEIPGDRVRDPDRARSARRTPVRLAPDTSAAVDALARSAGVTPFVVLLAAFQLLLRRYTGSDDIIVGTPTAGRTRVETEALIGFFVNTLVLRTDLSGAPTFRQLVARTRDTVLGAMAHQDVPFERIVEAVQPERDRARNPLFDALFSVQDAGTGKDFALDGVTATKLAGARDTAKFDLQLILSAGANGYAGALEYDADLYDDAAMQRLGAHFTTLVRSAMATPDDAIDALRLMDDAERAATLARSAGPSVARDPSASVVGLVRAQIAATPDAVALTHEGTSITYAQLGARADALAARLQGLGVTRGDRVAICAERTVDVLCAVLGTLAAGAAYVPIDPAYPAARTTYMFEQSRARVLLASSAGALRLPAHRTTLLLEDAFAPSATSPASTPASAADLTYVLYTSGSTGVPKGVAMGNGAMVNLLEWQRTTSAAMVGTRTLQFASLSFDVSFQEIFGTWTTGGTLVLVDEDTRRDPAALLKHMAKERIQRVFFPFIALEHLADAAASVDIALPLVEIITAGEQLRVTPAIRAFARRLPGCELANHYGPTETHVVTAMTMRGDPDAWPALPSIGRPIDNVLALVLDARGEPVPDGLPGELYLGGLALANGYLDDPARTAERFGAAPAGSPHPRAYRTGDVARVRSDGALDYLGRADDQVKIRGFRVELGEIERVLSESPLVAACAVALRGDNSADKRLIAYCVLRDGSEAGKAIGSLQAWCREKLPDYMLPAGYVPMDRLPLTPSGKVDRRSLPATDPVTAADDGAFAEPSTPLEIAIAAVWSDVLRAPRVGRDDDFFRLGGHSLLATRMVSRVRDQTKRDVPLRVLFDHPVLSAFASAVEALGVASGAAAGGPIRAASRDAARRPAPPGRPA